MNQDKHNKQKSDERQAMKYLLGEMPEKEQEQFEARYFADDALFEELAIAKEELIDRYVRGQLEARKQWQFEQQLDQSPSLRQEVEFAQSLRQTLSASPSRIKTEKNALFNQSWLSPVGARTRVWAALLLIIGIGGLGWLWRENRGLRRELATLRAEQAAQLLREQGLQQQLAELRGHPIPTPPPEIQPGRTPSPAPPENAANGMVFAINLTSAVRRGENSETFRLPAKTGSVRLRIILNFQPQPRDCRLTLRAVDGRQIVFRTVRVKYKNDSYVIETDLSAALFKTGEYLAVVEATGTDRQIVKREYGFRIER